MKYSLLYVEDDRHLAELNIEYLSNAGFHVVYASSGEAALDIFAKYPFDVILLDIMMPGAGGYEVAKKIRAKNNQVPIIFLTSLAHKNNAVKGLNMGADDYIRKDADMDEVAARIYRSLRTIPKASAKLIFTEATYLDTSTHEVVSYGVRSKLGIREYDLLYFLATNTNSIHTREVIISNVWRERLNGDVYLRKSLSKLRRVLSADAKIKIKTIKDVGVILLIA